MRVSTAQTFLRSSALMSKLSAEADLKQTQISTGKRVVNASDDPVAYRQLDSIKRGIAGDQAYAANVSTAQGVLEQSADTLTDIETQLQRATELMTSVGNGTLSDADRSAIGKEVETILDSLFSLANSRDSRGQPLFGGATGDLPYQKDADGKISYASSGEPASIPIGDQTTMQVGVPGDRAFKAGDKDMFAVISDFLTAFKAGGDISEAADAANAGLRDSMESVTIARTSVGARGTRLELMSDQLLDSLDAREDARSGVEDADLASTIAEFQKTLTILQATQASFTKLTSLSLFDYLR
jgi:flagellar hook-associated protein 3 FlgL